MTLDKLIRAFEQGDGATIQQHRTETIKALRELRDRRAGVLSKFVGKPNTEEIRNEIKAAAVAALRGEAKT